MPGQHRSPLARNIGRKIDNVACCLSSRIGCFSGVDERTFPVRFRRLVHELMVKCLVGSTSQHTPDVPIVQGEPESASLTSIGAMSCVIRSFIAWMFSKRQDSE